MKVDYTWFMIGILGFLAKDHDRLDALFSKACANEARIDRDVYEAFRLGLLKHVGMEELILLPAAHAEGPHVWASIGRALAAAGFAGLGDV